jgi:hypothetical protein
MIRIRITAVLTAWGRAHVQLKECTIVGMNYNGVSGSDNATIEMDACSISGSGMAAVYLEGACKVTLKGSHLFGKPSYTHTHTHTETHIYMYMHTHTSHTHIHTHTHTHTHTRVSLSYTHRQPLLYQRMGGLRRGTMDQGSWDRPF